MSDINTCLISMSLISTCAWYQYVLISTRVRYQHALDINTCLISTSVWYRFVSDIDLCPISTIAWLWHMSDIQLYSQSTKYIFTIVYRYQKGCKRIWQIQGDREKQNIYLQLIDPVLTFTSVIKQSWYVSLSNSLLNCVSWEIFFSNILSVLKK